ncbi:hypothetical protein FJT64_020394 [Amphibalanus amphitrite]|uniref:Uncharacterized protein n=1 Tax=Amphibalanus amphitrite TaxID=1232801 RepID=A0A6A4WSX1_AMPAM|nr:hypothetical protein FJT64_020394 [Amphibalanus amphitrite]
MVVKPSDRLPSATTSPAESESTTATTTDSAKRFFRSRDLNRKATVVMSKELKYQVTSGGLVRTPAPTRRGPYKNVRVPPARSAAAASTSSSGGGSRLTEQQRELLAAIESLDAPEPASPRPGTPATPGTPCTPASSLRLELESEEEEEVSPVRRSPRKHRTPAAAGTPRQQKRTVVAAGTPTTSGQGTPAGAGTPLRRSPRKLSRPLPALAAAGTPTHAENEGPTRLTLTPRRSPRKHQQSTQAASAASPSGQRTPQAVYDRLEEALLKMEAGEDKENESPQRRKKDEQPKFYSIFYRRADGSSGSRGAPAPAPAPASSAAK